MSNALQTTDTSDLPQLFELAKQLVPTGFLPQHLKTPGQVVAVILAGRELGMPPMRALRSLKLVKGNVTESADSQLGRFKAAGGKAAFEKLDETEAVLKLTHPNGDEHVERFTMDDAKNAGLTANDTYKKYPKAMLRSRVITAGLKSVGWDGGAGVYDPAELSDEPERREVSVVMPQAKKQADEPRAAGLDMHEAIRSAERAAGSPPQPGETITVIDDVSQGDIERALKQSLVVINTAQRKKLFATLGDSAHDEEQFRDWLQNVAGLTSTKEIPSAGLDAILRRLEDPTPLAQDYANE